MAYACGHTHKSHYSNGMCQNCYLAKYYLKRKNKASEKNSVKGGSVENLVNLEQKAISKTSDQSEQMLKEAENSTESDYQTGSKRQKME